MNFYIDFEATQPQCEIIAIGAVAENGATFHSLVKPQLSSISQYVSQLTHISTEDLEKAPNINEALRSFDWWVIQQEPDIMKRHFIAYGDDNKFIQSTLPAITEQHAFTVAAVLMAKIEDYSGEAYKFFHGSIKLIHAFNFVQSMEVEQKHNPLEDAKMLQKVYEYTQTHEPLAQHPLKRINNENEADIKMPSSNFWCQPSLKRGAKIYSFNTCEEAIEWLITNIMKHKQPEIVHRDRIMANIMKAIRKKEKYCNLYWSRAKKEESINE